MMRRDTQMPLPLRDRDAVVKRAGLNAEYSGAGEDNSSYKCFHDVRITQTGSLQP